MNHVRCAARRRCTAAITVGLLLAMAGGVQADSKASRGCRQAIAKELGRVIKAGLAGIDACRAGLDRAGAPAGACNVAGAPEADGKAKYRRAKERAAARIGSKCAASDPVLANFDQGSVTTATYARIDDLLAGNSALVLGNGDLDRDKKRVKCVAALGRERSRIVNAVVGKSVGCQARRDRRAATFGAAEATCLSSGGGAVKAAGSSIGRACGKVTGVEACSPLPSCATEAAVDAGQSLARIVFSALPDAVCGDGVVEDPEQCDDGNAADGDGCSRRCEIEGRTCHGKLGERTVTVAITTPTPLAGVRIDVDYPQFQTGLPGTGHSTLVGDRVVLLQGAPKTVAVVNDRDSDLSVALGARDAALASGDLLRVTFDACVAKETNLCNRNQNVIGCCDIGADTDGDGIANECNRCTGAGTKTGAACIANPDCLGQQQGTCPAGVCVGAGDKTGNVCVANPDCLGQIQGTCIDSRDNPPACTSFPTDALGAGNAEDCCPADNACILQVPSVSQPDRPVATTCAVSQPVDAAGKPVVGVTCTIAVGGV